MDQIFQHFVVHPFFLLSTPVAFLSELLIYLWGVIKGKVVRNLDILIHWSKGGANSFEHIISYLRIHINGFRVRIQAYFA